MNVTFTYSLMPASGKFKIPKSCKHNEDSHIRKKKRGIDGNDST